ncbi:MAG: hypothetical protein DLM69_12385 [Candidatus Chloroheliales bacterium]|nr:MAG: hypothetical protein DLM69_12385 [Chloroflexota bacterium]
MYDLNAFRQRVLQLCREAPATADGQRPTQAVLAHEVGLARAELSRRLGGKSRTSLSCENARAIVLTLARWGALQTQDGALELLRLVDCPPFSAERWQRPPLDQLAPLSPAARAQLGQTTGNLPLQLTSFVGREAELALVSPQLATSRLKLESEASFAHPTRACDG